MVAVGVDICHVLDLGGRAAWPATESASIGSRMQQSLECLLGVGTAALRHCLEFVAVTHHDRRTGTRAEPVGMVDDRIEHGLEVDARRC